MADRATGGDGRLTRNSAAMVTARFTVAVAGLTTLPMLYDRLGAAEFGIWVLLGGVVGALALVDLGLGSALVRQVARTVAGQPDRMTRAVLGVGLLWGVTLWLLASAGTVAAWSSLARMVQLGDLAAEARDALLILLLGLLCDGAALPWRAVLEGAQHYTTLAWVTAGTAVLGAVLAVMVVRLGGGLSALAASTAAVGAVRTTLVVTAARHRYRRLTPSLRGLRRAGLRDLFNYGLRVQVTNAAGAVNLELDRFVLGGVAGPTVAGAFELGSRLLNMFRLPPAIVLMAMFPMAVSRTAAEGRIWLDRFHLVTTRYLTAFAAVGTALLVVSAEPLIRLWLGQPVWWATASIVVLAPSYALNLIAGATAIVLRVENQPGRETGYALLSVVLNLALTWPLWRLFGPLGVPLATSCGIAVGTVYFVVRFHRSTGRPIAPTLAAVRPAASAAILAGLGGTVAARFLPDGPGRLDAALAVLTRSGVVLLVALGVLVGAGFFSAQDRARLRRLTRRPRPVSPMREAA
ncbi:oligosaccharide flippase family protein [Micromonospora sp. WMMD1102]|uniref:lipopolysaccharide biosynthesis protein n=1 Tax=Micromonospora sp. WMMD1102 TaxID=3016105 RepID=UPI00241558D9|nr:oligosaccharide flippase family protein [Micromonospora sp. WMMD1102]MDG4786348.1 oligosaccharide flippase family protein [Micromonospora sp. WMMD1102]